MTLKATVVIKTRVTTGQDVECLVHALFEHPVYGTLHGVRYFHSSHSYVKAKWVRYFDDIDTAKKVYIRTHSLMLVEDSPKCDEGRAEPPVILKDFDIDGFWRNAVNSDH